MVLIALDDDAELPDGDDAADHAGPQPGLFELGALLDMHFEETLVAAGVQLGPGDTLQPRFAQRVAQGLAGGAVHRGVDLRLFQNAEQAFAAQEAAEMAFLIGAGHHIHRQAGAGQGQAGHHAERTIEPTRLILAFEMAAGEELDARPRMLAEHIADAIDGGFKADLLHLLHQPMPALHVLGREGGAVHACLEAAELAQRVQVLEEAGGVDLYHGRECAHGRCGRVGGVGGETAAAGGKERPWPPKPWA